MARVFLRDYQEHAVGEVIRVFMELDARRLARGEPLPWEKRVTIIVSPTASGKTMVMKSIADRLSERGYPTLVLAPLVTVEEQCREAGLEVTTAQRLASAFKAARKHGLRGRNARIFVAEKIGLPSFFFDQEIMILVDESHWGAENLTKIYQENIALTKARMIVGFTGTPRWKDVFNTIDLSDRVKVHVAPPLKSVVYTHSLLTLHNQLSLFPVPGLIFTQSVPVAALLTTVANVLAADPREALLIVGSARSSLETSVRSMFPKGEDSAPAFYAMEPGTGAILPEKKSGQKLQAMSGAPKMTFRQLDRNDPLFFEGSRRLSHGGGVEQAGEALVWSLGASSVALAETTSIDRSERSLAIITLLLVLDGLRRQGAAVARRELEAIINELPGLPEAAASLRLIANYRPDLHADYRAAMASGSLAAVQAVCQAVRSIVLDSAASPDAMIQGKCHWGVSVQKIATGFNLPSLRTVCMAESVTDSAVLYKQRAGRGARKTDDKQFFDLIDVCYFDPMSDAAGANRISWLNTLVEDSQTRRQLESQDLIFRELAGSDTSS